MFRLGLAVLFAIFARIQGKKAQQSISSAFSDLRRHRSYPLVVALLVFVFLLVVAGFVLSSVASVWENANKLGGAWFGVITIATLGCISAVVFFVVKRLNRRERRRLASRDDSLFITSEAPKPLPAPDSKDQRFNKIRDRLRQTLEHPAAQILTDSDVAFLRNDQRKRELIEDELKKHIRNLVDSAKTDSDAAGQSAQLLADNLVRLNAKQADWCRAELSTLRDIAD